MTKKKEIRFLEDDVKKTCINKRNAKGEQWFTKMSAGVLTYSFHLVSSSEGYLKLHKDLLNEKGKTIGKDYTPTVTKISEIDLTDKVHTYSSSDKFVFFPMTPNIEINTVAASSQQIKSRDGKGKVLMVEYK